MFTTVNAKTVADAEKSVNISPLKMYVCGAIRNFFKEGTSNFNIFSSVVFSGRINLKQVEKQKKGSGGMLPRKIFENSHTVIAILVHFEQISGKLY